jgi:hypothetical protein
MDLPAGRQRMTNAAARIKAATRPILNFGFIT